MKKTHVIIKLHLPYKGEWVERSSIERRCHVIMIDHDSSAY